MSATDSQTVIGARSTTFFDLFLSGRFEVPWHQRRYDWKAEHVDELLHDIADAVDANRRCYFLGTIILVKSPSNAWRINDGQQRMVTLSVICARLRNLFSAQDDSHRVHAAHRILFDIPENATVSVDSLDRLTPRLKPPRDDKAHYNLLVRGRRIGTNGKLTLAWHEIENFIAGMGIEKAKLLTWDS